MGHIKVSKLIAIGNTSLAVILPKTWLEFYGLTKGDKIQLISNGGIRIKKIEGGE